MPDAVTGQLLPPVWSWLKAQSHERSGPHLRGRWPALWRPTGAAQNTRCPSFLFPPNARPGQKADETAGGGATTIRLKSSGVFRPLQNFCAKDCRSEQRREQSDSPSGDRLANGTQALVLVLRLSVTVRAMRAEESQRPIRRDRSKAEPESTRCRLW
jgi:hypothetical protein